MNANKPDAGPILTEKTHDRVNINSRRWHFLLIGEHGQIKSVKKFRGLVIAAIAVVVIAVIGIAGLGFLYVRGLAHNTKLSHRIADLRQQVTAIQAEKEILMARLVIAETKLAGAPNPTTTAPSETRSAQTDTASTPADGPSTQPQVAAIKQPAPVTPPRRGAGATPSIDLSPPSTEAQVDIAVDEFQAVLDTYQNILTVQYKVLNTRTDGTKVAGHTVVVLANSEQDKSTWVTLPNVKLVDGRPTGDQGQPFRIARFRVAKFTIEGYAEPDQFDIATVFVFTRNGELILEKEFSIQIKVT
jgi:hypothetical protein